MPVETLAGEVSAALSGCADRESELERLLLLHESQMAAMPWNELRSSASKVDVDFLVTHFQSNNDDFYPRSYELFSDVEVRDAICRSIGASYQSLPDLGDRSTDFNPLRFCLSTLAVLFALIALLHIATG